MIWGIKLIGRSNLTSRIGFSFATQYPSCCFKKSVTILFIEGSEARGEGISYKLTIYYIQRYYFRYKTQWSNLFSRIEFYLSCYTINTQLKPIFDWYLFSRIGLSFFFLRCKTHWSFKFTLEARFSALISNI